jgi:hypothetical protein
MATLTADVFDSPAVGILCGLEADGFRVTLTSAGVVTIAPRSRLTTERMAAISAHKDALRTLLRICDEGVQERRESFARQLAAAPSSAAVPPLQFREAPYVSARCHACGDSLESPQWGSCWRCVLARRLVCHAPIAADLLAVYDEARVCA